MFETTESAYRHRLLDIPLLYCFYKSRSFKDCICFREFKKLQEVNLEYEGYSKEEKFFLLEQKNKLLMEYEEALQSKIDERVKNEKNWIQVLRIEEDVQDNLTAFWKQKGREVLNEYSDKLLTPVGEIISGANPDEELQRCKILVLTANYIEGVTVERLLNEHNSVALSDRIVRDKQLYQFSKINGIPVVHVWPQGTSSFTTYGSFQSLRAAFRRFNPEMVISLGVAFGANPAEQCLGDVLVADHLIFYDSFNKVTESELKLSPDEVQEVGGELLAGLPMISDEQKPLDYGISDFAGSAFLWRRGTILTGGSVLSDADEKIRLMDAAKKIGREPVGGEMEGSGVYFACNMEEPPIPFLTVKGICDWGVKKNGWDFAGSNTTLIKNCIQAYATQNAFKTVVFILSQLYSSKKEAGDRRITETTKPESMVSRSG